MQEIIALGPQAIGPLNSASQWRLAVGRRVAAAYAANPKVAAVIVGGSTCRGHADRYSDIEVGVFWHEPPTEEDRRQAADATGGDVHRLYPYDAQEEVWEDVLFMGRVAPDQPVTGVMVEIPHYTTEFVERVLVDVLEHYDPSELKQKLLSVFTQAIPVHGAALIEAWRSRVADYPRGLALAMVKQHGQIEFFWYTDMYLERGNNLMMVYDKLVTVSKDLSYLLLALNGVYFSGFKWMHLQRKQMRIIPPNFEDRLRHVFEAESRTAMLELPALVEEVYSLIEATFPEVDVARLRHFFRYSPQLWDHPPGDIALDSRYGF